MIEKIKKLEAEQVIVFAFSRFARSTIYVLKGLQIFKDCKTRFVSITENIDAESSVGVAMFTILGSLAQLERSMIQERVKAGMKNAKAKGKMIGRVRKRNSSLIESLLEAGLSYREIAGIAKRSHRSVRAQKKEFLARKSKEQQQKLDDLQKQMMENCSENPIDTMKSMNVPDEVIQQVQVEIETEARNKVHEITGGAGYETYDWSYRVKNRGSKNRSLFFCLK